MRDLNPQQRNDIIQQFAEGHSIAEIRRLNECRSAFGFTCEVDVIEQALRDALGEAASAIACLLDEMDHPGLYGERLPQMKQRADAVRKVLWAARKQWSEKGSPSIVVGLNF